MIELGFRMISEPTDGILGGAGGSAFFRASCCCQRSVQNTEAFHSQSKLHQDGSEGCLRAGGVRPGVAMESISVEVLLINTNSRVSVSISPNMSPSIISLRF